MANGDNQDPQKTIEMGLAAQEFIKKKKEEAFNLSKINRMESDKLEQEAYEISKKIDLLDKEQNNA